MRASRRLDVFIAFGKLMTIGADGESPVSTIGVNSAGSSAESRVGSVPVTARPDGGRRDQHGGEADRQRGPSGCARSRHDGRACRHRRRRRTGWRGRSLRPSAIRQSPGSIAGTAASCGCRPLRCGRRQDSTMSDRRPVARPWLASPGRSSRRMAGVTRRGARAARRRRTDTARAGPRRSPAPRGRSGRRGSRRWSGT